MDIRLSFSGALVAAVVLAQLVSVLWYSHTFPWGHYGDRYFLTAIIADIGLAVLVQMIIQNYWKIRSWEDAAWLAMWLGLLYAAFQAPHEVHNERSFSRFFFNAAHKFVIIFTMGMAFLFFKDY